MRVFVVLNACARTQMYASSHDRAHAKNVSFWKKKVMTWYYGSGRSPHRPRHAFSLEMDGWMARAPAFACVCACVCNSVYLYVCACVNKLAKKAKLFLCLFSTSFLFFSSSSCFGYVQSLVDGLEHLKITNPTPIQVSSCWYILFNYIFYAGFLFLCLFIVFFILVFVNIFFQEKGIGAILSGGDVILSAETGTGKTLTFLLPLMHRLLQDLKE